MKKSHYIVGSQDGDWDIEHIEASNRKAALEEYIDRMGIANDDLDDYPKFGVVLEKDVDWFVLEPVISVSIRAIASGAGRIGWEEHEEH